MYDCCLGLFLSGSAELPITIMLRDVLHVVCRRTTGRTDRGRTMTTERTTGRTDRGRRRRRQDTTGRTHRGRTTTTGRTTERTHGRTEDDHGDDGTDTTNNMYMYMYIYIYIYIYSSKVSNTTLGSRFQRKRKLAIKAHFWTCIDITRRLATINKTFAVDCARR